MSAILLAAALLAQGPTVPGASELRSPTSEESGPARAPDAVELPMTTKRGGNAARGATGPTPNPARPPRTYRTSSGKSDCLNLGYADAHPETCGAGISSEHSTQTAPPSPPRAVAVSPAPTNLAKPEKAVDTSTGARPIPSWMFAVGAVGLALMSALFVLLVRTRATHTVGVREVELHGPELKVLPPAALARGIRGPAKSRWSVRDGRLFLTGPAGTLLNGVRLDRAGEIVSTGDTVRLGGAEYRVRIV